MFADSAQVERDIQWLKGRANLLDVAPAYLIPDDFWPSICITAYPDYQGSDRIGFYYQWLVRLCIENSSGYRLIGEEIQVFDQGTTLGAIDFIVQNPAGELEHWEVAIKFYLAFDGQWYGPNAKDTLAKKYQKMRSHQLALTQSDAFLAQHPDIKIAHRRLLLQGRLYRGLDADTYSESNPPGIPPTCVNGYWRYANQLSEEQTLYSLERVQWMTGPHQGSRSPLDVSEIHRPVHCVDDAGDFYFIVPSDWPGR